LAQRIFIHHTVGPFWEEYHENRRCSRDTYSKSYITNYTSRHVSPSIQVDMYHEVHWSYITEYADHISPSTLVCEEYTSSPGWQLWEHMPAVPPLPSEYGTFQTDKARFWPWLPLKSPHNVLRCSLFARNRVWGFCLWREEGATKKV